MQQTQNHTSMIEDLCARIDNSLTHSLGKINTAQKKELLQAITIAVDHAQNIVATLPNPLLVEEHLWTGRQLVPIIFASAQDALEIMGRSQALRQLFSDPYLSTCFLLMTMHRHEYETLGHEMDGEIVKREVLQTVVDFTDHRIDLVASTMPALTRKLMEHIVLYLAGLVPEQRQQSLATQKNLRDNQELIKAQMRTLQLARQEYSPFTMPTPLKDKLDQGQAAMQSMTDQLHALSTDLSSQDSFEQILDILAHPKEYIRLEPITEYLLDFGIKSVQGQAVNFLDCIYDQDKRSTVLLLGLTRATAQKIWPNL